MTHKKYGLLEDGSIEPLWYCNLYALDESEMRDIEEENGKYYLYHDRASFDENGKLTRIAYCKHEIIKEADNVEELK